MDLFVSLSFLFFFYNPWKFRKVNLWQNNKRKKPEIMKKPTRLAPPLVIPHALAVYKLVSLFCSTPKLQTTPLDPSPPHRKEVSLPLLSRLPSSILVRIRRPGPPPPIAPPAAGSEDERRRCVEADSADGPVHPPGGGGEGQRDLRLRRRGARASPFPLDSSRLIRHLEAFLPWPDR